MNLYLDDDSAKALLVSLLQKAGHRVVVPANVGLRGADDAEHLLHAVQKDLVLMTRNHDDFRTLHLLVQATGGRHTGIFVVRPHARHERSRRCSVDCQLGSGGGAYRK